MSSSACFPVGNIRTFLSGKWNIQRTIIDRSSGIVGSFVGFASLETTKSKTSLSEKLKDSLAVIEKRRGLSNVQTDIFLYREEGEVQYSEPQVRVCRATRQYLYVFPMHEEEKASSFVDIYFEDGRFFHSLSLADGKHRAWHLCGEDHYNAEYEVVSESEWRCTWNVTGPRKDQILRTTFHRIDASPH